MGMFSGLSLKEWLFFVAVFFVAVYVGPIITATFPMLGVVSILVAPSFMYVIWEKWVKQKAR